MRLPLIITLLCMTLAASARAQLKALDYVVLVPDPGPLSFNPTVSGSPYPFRLAPTLSVAASPCSNTDNTLPGPGYTRCFKSFPQYVNPITPSSGGYNFKVTNCQTTNIVLQMKFGLTQNSTLLTVSALYTNASLPANRIEYSVDGGGWNSVPTVLTNPSFNPVNAGYRTIKPSIVPNCLNPLTVQVRFRLRLEGDESATGANYTSAVDFRVQ